MLISINRIFVTWIVALLPVSAAWAGGGWPQPRHEGYFKFSQNYIGANDFYGPDGEITSITTVRLYITSLYAEYGFSNRLTALLYFPMFMRNTLNAVEFRQTGKRSEGDAVNSIGDIEMGFKYGLIMDKPIVVSATLAFGLPTGETSGGTSGILQTGDGEFNQLLRIDASASLPGVPMWVSAYAGYNNRTNDFSDEGRFGGEVGYNHKDKLLAIVKLDIVQSLYNGDAIPAEANAIFSNNTEYVSPTVELAWQMTKSVGVTVSGGFALAGKNILASPNYGIGLYWRKK